MHILYYAKVTAALPAQIALEESGAEYESRLLEFSNKDQMSEAYLKINPKARVPALITPKGILTETCAILAYVAQTWPQADLAPTDPFEFGLAQAFNNYIAATVHVAHAHKLRGTRWTDDPAAIESMRAKVTENMAECAKLIENEYFKGPWVLGEKYSICDPYLYLVARWLPADGVNLDGFLKIKAHYQRMQDRPAVANVAKLHE